MIKHKKLRKNAEEINLLYDDAPPLEMKSDEPEDDTFYPHWKPTIDMNLIYDTTSYKRDSGSMPKELMHFLTVDPELQAYEPILYMSDFWCLNKYLVPLNESV